MAEELEFNLFYCALMDNFYDKLLEAQEKSCVICIPRNKYLTGIEITLEFIKNHILIPSPYFDDVYFTYFNYTSFLFRILNNVLERVPLHKGDNVEGKIKILSKEISYNQDLKPYTIIVIDGVLGHLQIKNFRIKECCPSNITTLPDAIKFLRSQPDAKAVFKRLDNRIRAILESSDEHFLFANIHLLLDEEMLKLKHLHGNRPCPRFHKIACLALECYVSAKSHHHVFPLILKQQGKEDLLMWEAAMKLSLDKTGLKRFSIPMDHMLLSKPVKILKQMDNMKHHIDILNGMKKIITLISTKNESTLIGSDELLISIVALFCKVKLQNLASILNYANRMMWRTSQYDPMSFALVTFQAASDILLDYTKSDE